LGQYFNQPINANCITSGDLPPGEKDALVYCDCLSRHDTILVQISAPSACCYSMVTIFILKNRFRTEAEFSFDVAPQLVNLTSEGEELILKNNSLKKGDLLQGHILFKGNGQYAKAYQEELSADDLKMIFKGKVEGYFKCRLK
jgi:hypothetical protein